MKNTIQKFLFLFYKYYDKGSTKDIAYFSALAALLIVIYLNTLTVLIISGVLKKHPEISEETPIYIKYILGYIIIIPAMFVLKIIFKKEDVLKIEMGNAAMRNGYILIVLYIIISITMLILSVKYK
jgi:hypothetical protein